MDALDLSQSLNMVGWLRTVTVMNDECRHRVQRPDRILDLAVRALQIPDYKNLLTYASKGTRFVRLSSAM
jgi:hypothetical protein